MLRLAPVLPIALWVLIYPARMILTHLRFDTNAYDLSVFDYAMWNLLDGGFVPFFGKSLFADHAMPTLAALLPVYWISPGPVLLIAVQATAMLSAAILLSILMRGRISTLMMVALLLAFLFSRRSHSALMSMFYVESLEPMLILGMILAWEARRWGWFALCAALALGCKEDVAIYVACFGAVMWWRGDRRAAVVTSVAAVAWLAIALTVVVPASRRHSGLSADNPLWADRFPGTTAIALGRAVSGLGELAQLAATTGFVAVGGPQWLAVALPGAIANIAAAPDKQQSGLTGHYFWPLMPWLFVAALHGAQRMEAWNRRLGSAFAVALIAFVAGDSPLWRAVSRGFPVGATEATAIRQALRVIPEAASLTAMPNLVPHVPHRTVVRTIGINEPREATEYVVLSVAGDLWPLSKAAVEARIACLAGDAGFERIGSGDPAIFRRLGETGALPVCAP